MASIYSPGGGGIFGGLGYEPVGWRTGEYDPLPGSFMDRWAPAGGMPAAVAPWNSPLFGGGDAMPPQAQPVGPQPAPPMQQPAAQGGNMPSAIGNLPTPWNPLGFGRPDSPGVGDRLMAGLMGFTQSGNPIAGLGNLIGGLVTGERNDPLGVAIGASKSKRAQEISSQMAIFNAVLERGGTQAQAVAAAVNPKAAEIILGQAYPKAEFKTWGPDVNAGFVTPPGLAGRPGISPIQAAGPKPDDISGMRKEVSALPEIKKYQEAAPIFNSMVKSLNNKSRAADLDFVYGMAKVFDPDSVVREGEMIIVKQAQNLPDAILGEINRVTAGQGLSDKTRRELLEVARNRMEQYRGSVDPIVGAYRERAMRQRMLPEDVLPKLTDLGSIPGAPPATSVPIPSPAAIKALRGDPRLLQQFEQKYGPGSAKKYLGQ